MEVAPTASRVSKENSPQKLSFRVQKDRKIELARDPRVAREGGAFHDRARSPVTTEASTLAKYRSLKDLIKPPNPS